MSTVTPLLDTLLPQVHGRRAKLQRFAGPRQLLPLSAIVAVNATRSDGAERPAAGQALPDKPARQAQASHSQTTSVAGRAEPRSATVAARYARPVAAETGTPGASARPQLSREGGVIAGLLARDATGAAAAPSAALALFGAARAPSTALLARVLGQQVAHSGMFYESHLARWFHGERSSDQLREEPHNRPDAPAREHAAPARPPRFAPLARALAASADGVVALNGDSRAPRDDGDSRPLIDDRLLSLVRQQLDVLSSAIFRWQGEAWPGVDMQWQIQVREDDEDAASREPDAGDTRRFCTRLSLELPRLGRLEVAIELAGAEIDVYACAASEHAGQTLRPAIAALEHRFEQAGFASAHVRLIETPAA